MFDNLIEVKKKEFGLAEQDKHSYYSNDSLFSIKHIQEPEDNQVSQKIFFKIYDYFSGNFLDSLLIKEFEPTAGFAVRYHFCTIFQHKGLLFIK